MDLMTVDENHDIITKVKFEIRKDMMKPIDTHRVIHCFRTPYIILNIE